MGKLKIWGAASMASFLAATCLLVSSQAQALSPPLVDKAEIVFSNGGRILSMQADGSGRTVLTHPDLGEGEYDDGDESPEISPDGSRLLFLRTNEDQDDVYTYDLMVASRQGADPASIVRGESSNDAVGATFVDSPTWSADGQSIFYLEMTYRKSMLTTRVVRVNTSGSARLVLASRRVNYKELKYVNGQVRSRDAALYTGVDASPDGTRLLIDMTSLFYKSGLASDLVALDLATNKVSTLEKSAEEGSWSPDGSQIAFTSERQRKDEDCYESFCEYQSKVFVMNADGSGAHPVVRDSKSGDEESPSWSGDSTRIAFSSNRNDPEADFFSMEVYSVGADGSCLTWLTNGSPFSISAQWAPEPLSSDPGTCGDAGREPLVDSALFASPVSSDEPAYWLGPVFKGMAPLYFPSGSGFGGGFNQYGDCVSYDPAVCHDRTEVTVISRTACMSPITARLQRGAFAGLKEKRGALLFGSAKSGWSNPVIATGQSVVSMHAYGPRGGLSVTKTAPIVKEAFGQLRLSGTDEPIAFFPEAKLNRTDVNVAARIAAKVKRAGSVRKLDESTKGISARQIRSSLRFNAAVRRLGDVKTVKCPRRKVYFDRAVAYPLFTAP